MGLSSWQVLRAWTCHKQPNKHIMFLYFLIKLIETYLPVPIVCFSNEKTRPHHRTTAHVKYPYIDDVSEISIVGGLTPWFYVRSFSLRFRICSTNGPKYNPNINFYTILNRFLTKNHEHGPNSTKIDENLCGWIPGSKINIFSLSKIVKKAPKNQK